MDDFEKDAAEAIHRAAVDSMVDRPRSAGGRLLSAGSLRPGSAARSRPPSAHTITPRDGINNHSRPHSARGDIISAAQEREREMQRQRGLWKYGEDLEAELTKLAAERAAVITPRDGDSPRA